MWIADILAREVNYAIQEKRQKGDRFSIVTLVLADNEGKVGAVPELLKSYVWKSPATELVVVQLARAGNE